eukprot:1161195-Pelagomonas_calceolata.AAC.7
MHLARHRTPQPCTGPMSLYCSTRPSWQPWCMQQQSCAALTCPTCQRQCASELRSCKGKELQTVPHMFFAQLFITFPVQAVLDNARALFCDSHGRKRKTMLLHARYLLTYLTRAHRVEAAGLKRGALRAALEGTRKLKVRKVEGKKRALQDSLQSKCSSVGRCQGLLRLMRRCSAERPWGGICGGVYWIWHDDH